MLLVCLWCVFLKFVNLRNMTPSCLKCLAQNHKTSKKKGIAILSGLYNVKVYYTCPWCGGCKKSPRTTSLCSHIFLVHRDHGVYMYVVNIWTWSSAHALGGVSGVASFVNTDEQLQLNRGCCFLVKAMLPEGVPFHQFIINNPRLIFPRRA